MYLEIVSPEDTLFSGKVNAVTLPGINGEFEILKNHAPIVSVIGEGNIKIYGNTILKEKVEDKFIKTKRGCELAITSGIIEMKDNKIIILAD